VAFLPKPIACNGCPAENVGKSYVPGEGPEEARVAFIGQGPGEREAYVGRPFVGPSGERFNTWLNRAGFQRSECYVDNIVRCWLPKDRAPKKVEAEFCYAAHIYPSLSKLGSCEVIVPVGVPSAKQLTGTGGEKYVGSIFTGELRAPVQPTRSEE
jgi:DNA polymerase